MLFVADAGSGSIEAFLDNDITTRTVHKCLLAFLARFEVPKILVSDSGSEFVGHDLKG